MTSPMPLEDADWMDDAIATILGIAQSQEVLSADDLRRELRPAPHSSMVGTAFKEAHRLGYIERVGDKNSSAKSRNGSMIRTWTLHPNLRRNVA